jgi:hypothetical protein
MTNEVNNTGKKEVTFSDATTECYPPADAVSTSSFMNIPLQEDAYERARYDDEEWQSPQASDLQKADDDRQPLLSVEVPPAQTKEPVEKNNNRNGLLLLLACLVVTLVLGATADPAAPQLTKNSTVAPGLAEDSTTFSSETALDPVLGMQQLPEPADTYIQDSQSVIYTHDNNATTESNGQTNITIP